MPRDVPIPLKYYGGEMNGYRELTFSESLYQAIYSPRWRKGMGWVYSIQSNSPGHEVYVGSTVALKRRLWAHWRYLPVPKSMGWRVVAGLYATEAEARLSEKYYISRLPYLGLNFVNKRGIVKSCT